MLKVQRLPEIVPDENVKSVISSVFIVLSQLILFGTFTKVS